LTRQCLEILVANDWPIVIQTRSALVLRDLDILRQAKDCQIGLSITTSDDRIRRLFEPAAPPIGERLGALGELHDAGIRTYAMIAPILPGAENLPDQLAGKIDRVLLDRMNYHHADWVYRKHGLEQMKTDEYFAQVEHLLTRAFGMLGIPF
jgi:DNA repair photolyase